MKTKSAMHNVISLVTRQSTCLKWLRNSSMRLRPRAVRVSCIKKLPLQAGLYAQYRGVKTCGTIDISELSQISDTSHRGLLDLEDAGPTYPTVVQQARDNMRKFEECVLVTRVGGFYEVCLVIRIIMTFTDFE